MSKGVLVVTGGSRGIGGATACLAAQRGYIAAMVYLERDREAAELARQIEAAGGQAVLIRADVSKPDDVLRIFDQAAGAGPIVGLVNNAGATGGMSRLVDLRVEQLMQAFQMNAIAPFLCAREAVRRMGRSRGGSGGSIVNVSSAAARTGSPNVWVHYAASKAALDTMTIGLAKELAAEGIRVNAVRPGVIDTEIHSANSAELMTRMTQAIPMGRMGKPEEVARTIVWLLSDEASYVTGAIIDAGGGY